MKIELRRVQAEPLVLQEEFPASALDLETEEIKYDTPLSVRAEVSRITNAVSVSLRVSARRRMLCSLCLTEFTDELDRKMQFNYRVERFDTILDISRDIREEIMLDYPMKPLCNSQCRGLCPRCGKNLNEGGCSCGPT
ncbi:MAG: DUF177 domain-containing protein [Candidatus Omnitrophica bacterium]|nr:DUF177 domain-containing protein [Candidatus Omnitrophota bacterium]